MIYILYNCLCQLVDIRELLFVLIFVINRSFILFIVRLFVLFIVRLFVLFSFPSIPCLFIVQKRKSNSDPEPYSGISIPLTVTRSSTRCSTSSSRVNKHYTADSTDFVLVYEAKDLLPS